MTYNLAGGLPDPRIFPRNLKIFEMNFEQAISFNELDNEILKILRYRGINAKKEEILLTTGSIQGIFIFAYAFINSGDKVAIEYPTFAGAIRVFKSRGAKFVKIPVIPYYDLKIKEENGIKAVYVIPTGQNPTGIHMRLEDKKELLELAEEKDFIILEDDAYGLLNPEQPTLKSLDKNGRVVYITTLSKVLSPGIRLGIMVADKEIMEIFKLIKQNIDGGNSSPSLSLVYSSLKDGSFWDGLSKAKIIYKEKKEVMAEALKRYLPQAEWNYPEGGLFYFIRINGIDSEKILEKVKDRVIFSPGTKFFFDGYGKEYIRLSFSYSRPEEINEGIKIISEAIDNKIVSIE